MKTLTQILTALTATAALTACASIRLQPIEDQLRSDYGCIGVGEVGFVALFMNPEDAQQRATERAVQDYNNKCSPAEDKVLDTFYDHRTNTAYAFSKDDEK